MIRKYNVDFDFFKSPSVLNSYWAGFIAADGTIRTGGSYNQVCVGLAAKDKDHLVRMAKDAKYTGFIKDRQCHGFPTACIEVCGVKPWIEDLYKNFTDLSP